MRIDFLGIEAFLGVAECGSFNGAAQRLNLSQAALSHRMKRLEDDLGVKLFTRTTRQVALTPAGLELLPKVRLMMETLSGAYESLRSRARRLLQDGWTVLVDAAFLRAGERQAFADLAQAEGVPFHILACEAPPEVLRQRIAARQAAGSDASEATLAVLEQQLCWLEPLTAAERACALAAPAAA